MTFQSWTNDGVYFVTSFLDDPKDDFGVFAEGYWHAASNLAKDLLSGPKFPDYDAYPVVFLYRHSLELYLKNVIYKAVLLMALKGMDRIDTKLYNNHNLIILARLAAAILQRLFPADMSLQQIADKMLRVSSELSDIDPDSYAYRYPIDTQGGYSTPRHQAVNLKALSRTMDDLLEDMDTLDFGFQVETSQAQEIYEMLNDLE